MKRYLTAVFCLVLTLLCCKSSIAVPPYGPENADITVIVMDPMAGPLACDCVKGYAQRKYEALADYLTEKSGKTVRVVWSESLEVALAGDAKGKADLVIGKDSVVRAESKATKRSFDAIASLTDKQGSVMQRGLFVVKHDSPASTLLDVEGYTLLLGPADCDEKSMAPTNALKELDVSYTLGNEAASCSIAAKQLLAAPKDAKQVAVISSYAGPLLEGCGSIQKGDLRVIGETEEVPFISAFVASTLPADAKKMVMDNLMGLQKHPKLLEAMETKEGFKAYKPVSAQVDSSNVDSAKKKNLLK
jgi:ABC-type phosphate/phosphonate transport system substrate-binding protein